MKQQFVVENIKCEGCVATVKDGLEKLDGVESVKVDKSTKTVEVEGDVAEEKIKATLADLGYPVKKDGKGSSSLLGKLFGK